MKVSTHVRSMALLLCASAVLFGCGKKAEDKTPPTAADTAQTAPPPAAAATDDTKLDFAALDKSAPASPKIDAALAAQGKALFTSKTCVACHAFGKVVLGPDLTGVSKLRGEQWILAQIQHPTVMTAGDPISMKLKEEAVNKTQMLVPGGVTADEAKALLEYLKTDGT